MKKTLKIPPKNIKRKKTYFFYNLQAVRQYPAVRHHPAGLLGGDILATPHSASCPA
jgi:hypothetical protein